MKSDSRVLLSGSPHWVKALEPVLANARFAVSASEDPDRLPELSALLAPGSVDCYIQAPIDVTIGATTEMRRLRKVFNGEFLTRFDALETILPVLRPDAMVVLVAGDRHDGERTPDDPHARFDLLRVLAEAIRVDNPAMLAVVAGPRCSFDEIVAVAAARGRGESRAPTECTYHGPDLHYADWKTEILSLATTLGWERSIRPAPTSVR